MKNPARAGPGRQKPALGPLLPPPPPPRHTLSTGMLLPPPASLLPSCHCKQLPATACNQQPKKFPSEKMQKMQLLRERCPGGREGSIHVRLGRRAQPRYLLEKLTMTLKLLHQRLCGRVEAQKRKEKNKKNKRQPFFKGPGGYASHRIICLKHPHYQAEARQV